jgi:hypothetical protein
MAENIVNLITKLEGEDILFIKGKAYLVKPAETNDLDRVINRKCMD